MSKTGKVRLNRALKSFGNTKEDQKSNISGILGFVIAGKQAVEVPNRPGFVYVRLRDNLSEIIQAYNESVSPVYGLPVLVSRDTIDTTRYIVVGRETSRYSDWQSPTPYLPRHGNQHSFSIGTGGGGDIVWVYDRQFMPLLVTPSGSSGAGSVIIQPDIIWQQEQWRAVGGTGTSSLLGYKPTGTTNVLLLVYIDENGNPQTQLSPHFPGAVTGTYDIIPYIPSTPTALDIPIGAVRLASGTSQILWDNIYDLRTMFRDSISATGTGGGGGTGHTIQDDGVNQTTRSYLNFVGDAFVLYDNGTATVVSGTSGGGGGGAGTINVYDDSDAKGAMSGISFDDNLDVATTGSIAFITATGGAGGALTQIDKITVGATGTAQIVFSGIPDSYTNLKLVLVARGTRVDNSTNVLMYFNGDTGTNYNYQYFIAYGASTTANESLNKISMYLGAMPTALSPGPAASQFNVDLSGYRTPFNKTMWSSNVDYYSYSAGYQKQTTYSGYWKDVSPITSIHLYPQYGGFASGTVAVLYGMD